MPAISITSFATVTPNAGPQGIAAGPDGNLWFTEFTANQIGRITPAGGITEYGLPTANAGPQGIAAGPDGNLWFTEYGADQIGCISTSGVVREFSAGITPGSNPSSIVAGPDGNLWFTEFGGNSIGEITPGGVVNSFLLPTNNSEPADITVGPDGNLWFTEQGANQIGEISPNVTNPNPTITEFSAGISANAGLRGITPGPDGNLWFVESNLNQIASFNPTTDAVTEYGVNILGTTPNLQYITVGPDGNLWYTANSTDQIGTMTTAGVATSYSLNQSINTGPAGPMGIALGPDGNLWFTENNASAVGRLSGVPIATTTNLTTSNASVAYGATVVLTATVAAQQPGITTPLSGVVTFADGSRVLGAAAISGGVAVLSTDALSVGTHNITASYAPAPGNTSFNTSNSRPVNETVTAVGTSITLTGPSNATFGQVVTFMATVDAGDASSAATPTGAVGFYDGNTLLGTAPLSGGTAVFSTGTLAVGAHQITATYLPTANFTAGPSAQSPLIVSTAATNTTLSMTAPNVGTLVFGVPITLTATVTAASVQPTGVVNFFDGTALIGTSTVSGGLASLTTAALAAGDHADVYASFAPNASFSGSTSTPPLDVDITTASTTVTLATSASQGAAIGQLVQYTATVSATNSPAQPTGYVTFLDNGSAIGTATLSGGVAVLSAASTTVGSHTISAVYTPTGNFADNTDPSVVQPVYPPHGVATQLVFSQQPTFTLVNARFTPAVAVVVLDAWGVPVPTATAVTIAMGKNPGSASLAGTRTVTTVNGVATFTNLTLSRKGNGYTLTASVAGLPTITSASFVVSSATHFTLTNPPTTVQAAVPFNLTVVARDSAGNIDPLYQGTVRIWSNDPQAPTLLASYTFTAADQGQHVFSVILKSIGRYTVTVTDTHVSTVNVSRQFTVSGLVGNQLKTLTVKNVLGA